MTRIATVFITVIGLCCCCFFAYYINRKHDFCSLKHAPSFAVQIHQEKKTDLDDSKKSVRHQEKIFKSMSIKWPQRPIVLQELNGVMADHAPTVAATSSRKCLADFNNPIESNFMMKCGDKRDAWHDARKGSLSPSCQLAMGKGGFQQKLSFTI